MEKRGDLTTESHSDFDTTQKVKYAEANGTAVAGEKDKHNLKNPVELKFPTTPGYNWPILK